MPIIKSAIKRMRQEAKRKARNQNTKRSLRAEIKVLNAAIEAKDVKKANEALNKVQSNLDKAVKKNVLKKNTAARKLSRLSEQVKALGAKPVATKKAAPRTTTKTPVKKTTKPVTKKTVTKKTPAKKPATKTSK